MGKKIPILAAAFSFVVAGLGQFYVDRFLRGVFFLLAEVFTAIYYLKVSDKIGFTLNLLVSVWAAADAHMLAKKSGTEETTQKKEFYV
jgi:TM2 domain-containing membrane protein YozV